MIQVIPKLVTFDEFIAWYPENSEYRYELHNGVIIEMPKPTGKHSDVGGFLTAELNFEIRRQHLPYSIPIECVIKPYPDESGYEPDVIVLDRQAVKLEPRWAKESIITSGLSVRLIIILLSKFILALIVSWCVFSSNKLLSVCSFLFAYRNIAVDQNMLADPFFTEC